MRLSELKLFEEPIQTRSAEELWSEAESEASQYITTVVYYARPLKDKKDMIEVQFDQGGTRRKYGTMSEEDFNAAFAPMRPGQKPDAEGFLQYRSADVFDAFKYGGEPIKLSLSAPAGVDPTGQTVKLATGDYLLRQDMGDEFVYTVEKANYFDNNYVKKT